MGKPLKLLVVSDIHYAGPEEQTRVGYEGRTSTNPIQRLFLKLYRDNLWLKDPLAHNHFLDWFFEMCGSADLVVANGDFSCDSGFIGLADDAAFQSAEICLDKLRGQFGRKLYETMGDHELGKKSLVGGAGGLRLESFRRCVDRLKLKRFWKIKRGPYVVMGVTSTLIALDAMIREGLAGEQEEWRALRDQHIAEIDAAFQKLERGERVILFCHDPTALPFLAQIPSVRSQWGRIEQTVLGHLHSQFILNTAYRIGGITPEVNFAGMTISRITRALRKVKSWDPFKVVLCPSPTGIQAFKDGGFLTVDLDLEDPAPLDWQVHRIPWTGPPSPLG
ncbi:MAG: hypothetical protein ACPGVU_20050 [Limisphaerales bacterium]